MKGMNIRELKSFSDLEALYAGRENRLRWPQIFSLPGWMNAWWQHFGSDFELALWAVQREGKIVGIVPFKRIGRTASFIGDDSVCDYLDFVVVPGEESYFCEVLLDECAGRGINNLELSTLRPESVARRHVLPLAEKRGFQIVCRESDVSYEMALPENFDAYLEMLAGKQRHELLRKQRNLEMEIGASFAMLKDNEVTGQDIDTFLALMSGSRRDKAQFLTPNMQGFFRDATRVLSSYSVLRLGFLKLGAKPVAAVLGFDYNNYVYLYNSGYDPAYEGLSVGLLSKTSFICWSIEQKKRVFDFLKGPEIYKERLGGNPISLSACSITTG